MFGNLVTLNDDQIAEIATALFRRVDRVQTAKWSTEL